MLALGGLPAASTAGPDPLPTNLEQACRAFEREFVQLLFREMRRATLPTETGGSAGFARQTAQSLLDGQWAELASQGEGLGLWRVMLRQLEGDAVKSPGSGADQDGEDKSVSTPAASPSTPPGTTAAPAPETSFLLPEQAVRPGGGRRG